MMEEQCTKKEGIGIVELELEWGVAQVWKRIQGQLVDIYSTMWKGVLEYL